MMDNFDLIPYILSKITLFIMDVFGLVRKAPPSTLEEKSGTLMDVGSILPGQPPVLATFPIRMRQVACTGLFSAE